MATVPEDKPKHPGGRPTKYNHEFHPKLAAALASLGRTDKEIAYELEISVATLNNWKNEHPEFLESIKEKKNLVDSLIEDSLLKRAMGYIEKETKVFQHNGKIITKDINKVILPDTTAMIFWLKNRKPQEWRDTQKIDMGISGTVENKIEHVITFKDNED